ncbi:MAG: response regulator [Gemmataceae bacterium]
MLVLSRRVDEKIVLPDIQAEIQVLETKAGLARIGIKAPNQIGIFREEVWLRDHANDPTGKLLAPDQQLSRLRELNHLLRNQLSGAQIGLDLIRRQLQAGLLVPAQQTVHSIKNALSASKSEIENLSAEIAQDNQHSGCPRPEAKHLLLAEDNHNERELFAGLLRLAGLSVDTASNGNDVLAYLKEHQVPDALLLDMRMPQLDGPSTLKALKGHPNVDKMKVFAISGLAPSDFGIDAVQAGVKRWFQKPIEPEVILKELTAELGV